MTNSEKNLQRAAEAYSAFLAALGVDGNPNVDVEESGWRVAKLMAEWIACDDAKPPQFSLMPAPNHDIVTLDKLPFYSFCGHHFVPFFGTVSIAYVPNAFIAGLGGFVRVIDYFSRRPQFQENLTAQIADAIDAALAPESVSVVVTARQMCLELQGHGCGVEVTTKALRRRS